MCAADAAKTGAAGHTRIISSPVFSRGGSEKKALKMDRDACGYETRLYRQGLAEHGTALFAAAGTDGCLNRRHEDCKILHRLLQDVNAGAIVYAKPAQPCAPALYFLAQTAPDGIIKPEDSETRMFLHDLAVADGFDRPSIARALSGRKCVIVPQQGIVACGRTAAEAYVHFSAACFSGFVKFFSDTLQEGKTGGIENLREQAFLSACSHLPLPPVFNGGLMNGPFETGEQAKSAITEAGKKIIDLRLVDACFGNISYRVKDTLYISSSGSFLDELENDVLSASIKNGLCKTGKPSSELPAHLEIASLADCRAILHGHPLFSVIMSMDCLEKDCRHTGSCHLDCPAPREVGGIPVVPGETGSGRFGLCRTVPPAVKRTGAAIVYGHGVFTCATKDFNEALCRMAGIERTCREIYFERLSKTTGDYRWNLQA
ncbi:MAG: class II aldolase/adducin family protein [Desulfobacterales bacterium]